MKCCRSILITVQRDATQSSLFIILQVHSTCFGCQPHPSSGVHKTVTVSSGTGHIFLCAATSFQRGQDSASSLYMFRVSTTPIIRSTQNCNYSLRTGRIFLCSYLPPTWPRFCKFTLHVPGVNHTHHQEYTKL